MEHVLRSFWSVKLGGIRDKLKTGRGCEMRDTGRVMKTVFSETALVPILTRKRQNTLKIEGWDTCCGMKNRKSLLFSD